MSGILDSSNYYAKFSDGSEHELIEFDPPENDFEAEWYLRNYVTRAKELGQKFTGYLYKKDPKIDRLILEFNESIRWNHKK